MSKKTNQHGPRKSRVRNVIILVIILAVVGVLGYFVWTNYLHKGTGTTVDQTVVTKTKSFSYNKLSLSFNYPSNWTTTYDNKLLSGTVTSPDGNVTVRYGAVAIDPASAGNDCTLSAAGDSFVVSGMSWEADSSTSGFIFRQISNKYVPVTGATTYSYKFGLIDDTDNSFKNGKVGDAVCKVDKITASDLMITTDTDGSQYALSLDGSFKDLDAAGANLTQAQIDKDFASSDAKTARDIIKSATVK